MENRIGGNVKLPHDTNSKNRLDIADCRGQLRETQPNHETRTKIYCCARWPVNRFSARGLAELKQAVDSSQQQLLAATETIAAAVEARPAVDVASPPPSPDALRPPPKRAAAPAAAPAKTGGGVGADEVRAIIASELEAMRKRMEEKAPVRVDARRRGE